MTAEERQLLADLFERIRSISANPRDAQAEAFIAAAAREQPHAPYVLAQTVLIQRQALEAASRHIAELEAASRAGAPQAGETSFLGGLGKALFGAPSAPAAPARPPAYDSPAYRAQPTAAPQSYPAAPRRRLYDSSAFR